VKPPTVQPPLTQQSALLAVISRAAADPAVDIDKMERLFALQQSIIEQERKSAFNEAMNLAQTEMGLIAKNAKNSQTSSRYATYAQIDKAIRPIYTRHGFALSFDEADSPKPEHVRVMCYVSHKAGHTSNYHADLPNDGKGAKGGDVMTKTHATGAAKSYGQRYLVIGIFNLAIGEDTDGNTPVERITDKQVVEIEALLAEVNAKRDAFMRYYKIDKLSDIRASSYETIVKALVAKRKKL